MNARATQGLIPVMLLARLDNHIGRHIQLAPVKERAKKENENLQSKSGEVCRETVVFSRGGEAESKPNRELGSSEDPYPRDRPESRNYDPTMERCFGFCTNAKQETQECCGLIIWDDTSPLAKRRTREDLTLPDDTQEQWPLTPASSN